MQLIVGLFIVIGLGLSIFVYFAYQRILRRAKSIERGLKMVPILIHLPPPSSDTAAGSRDVRDVIREKISQAQVLYDVIAGTAQSGFRSRFYGQRHIALELIASHGLIHYYAAVPVAMVSTVKQAIVTAYPGAHLEEVEDYNIFNPGGRISGVYGGELTLKAEAAYPIATYDQLERDPMEAILNVLTGLGDGEGAGIQLMLRPANRGWVNRSLAIVRKKRQEAGLTNIGLDLTPKSLLKAAVKSPEEQRQKIASRSVAALQLTDLEQEVLKAIEEKTQHASYETLLRVVVSTASASRSQQVMNDLVAGFALFDAPGLNGYKFVPASNAEGLVTAFIFRFFPPELNHDILSSQEMATLFHLPDAQFTPTAAVDRQQSKQVDGPATLPQDGLLLGYNEYRGTKKEIRLSVADRRRHTYIVGQTGTGKSTLLENLAVQDMLAGNGFAFIDPHGDVAERLISMVPKHRSEDIIYFNPADTEFPLGLNLFEFTDPAQKDFLIQEALQMLYKLYDPGHTGIIGPRYEHWFRNAALTIMSDPAGATFIEIPKVFTDAAYLKQKFQYLQDPTVIDFWTKEMAATSDYHKSEVLGWFVSKFGAFQSNEIMRNIVGQTKSAFNLREVMDNKKILIVNLSKGQIGELNAQLLGMIFIIKFQAAAMSRASLPEEQRSDFSLYVDEFQNFSTDSFAAILSEARKYRLNLIVANQFIGQLTPEIKEAVFGNVGTIVSYRIGPEDADYLVKQFAPVFDAHDLVGLPNYHAVARLMISGLPSQPFSLSALPPLGMANPELGLAIKQLSAAKYGTQRQQAEADIYNRLRGLPATDPAAPAVPASQPTGNTPPLPTPAPAPPQPTPTPPPMPVATSQPATNHATLNITDIVKPGSAPSVSAAPPAAAVPVPAPAPMVQAEPPAPVPATPGPSSAPERLTEDKPKHHQQGPKPQSHPEPAHPSHGRTGHPHPSALPSSSPTAPPQPSVTAPAAADTSGPHSLAQEIKAAGLGGVIQVDPLDNVINTSSDILTPTEQLQAVAHNTPPPGANPFGQTSTQPQTVPVKPAQPVPQPKVPEVPQPAVVPKPVSPAPASVPPVPQPVPKASEPAKSAPIPTSAVPAAVGSTMPTPHTSYQSSAQAQSGLPALTPGEIYVDESGTVHVG